MAITCKVLEKHETMTGNKIVLGLPDENGEQVAITTCADDDVDALKQDACYTLAFVPWVEPDHPAAVASAVPKPDGPTDVPVVVPVVHPVVIDPVSAAECDPAVVPDSTAPSEVIDDEASDEVPPAADAATDAPAADEDSDSTGDESVD